MAARCRQDPNREALISDARARRFSGRVGTLGRVTMPGRADGSSQDTWRRSNGVESSGRGHPEQHGRQGLPIFRRELRRAIALSNDLPLGLKAVYQYCGEGLNVGDRDISPAARYRVYKSVTERSEVSAKNANKLNKERHVSLVTIVRFRR